MIAALLLAASLTTTIATIAKPIGGTVGVAAIHVESGKRVSVHGGEPFPMASVFKFPIALAVLQQVDDEKIFLTDEATIPPKRFSDGHSPLRDAAEGKPIHSTVGALLQASLRDSDNTANDYLLDLIGGAPAVMRYLKERGVRGVRVDRRENDVIADIRRKGEAAYVRDPRDTATPDGMVDLLARFARGKDGLSAESHEIAQRAMTETQTGPDRIRAGIPADALLAHKTGTMPRVLNDVGVITTPDGQHIAIAVFTKGSTASEEARAKVVAGIARLVIEELGR